MNRKDWDKNIEGIAEFREWMVKASFDKLLAASKELKTDKDEIKSLIRNEGRIQLIKMHKRFAEYDKKITFLSILVIIDLTVNIVQMILKN